MALVHVQLAQLIVAALIFGCPTATAGITQGYVMAESGIEGRVEIRPVRPHATIGSENSEPYSAVIQVLGIDRRPMTTIIADENGYFHIAMPPGQYIVVPLSKNLYPRASEQTVTVDPNRFTELRIIYDSGKR